MSLDNGADATQIFVKGREGFCLMGYRLSRVRLRGLQPSHSVCSVPHAVPVLIPLHPPEKPFCNLVGRFPSGCPYIYGSVLVPAGQHSSVPLESQLLVLALSVIDGCIWGRGHFPAVTFPLSENSSR